MKICTEAAGYLPENLDLLLLQAEEYKFEAHLCALRFDAPESQKYTDRAIVVYNRILGLVPECVQAFKGKGCALKDSPVVSSNKNKESQAVLKEAIDCFDRAIMICPNDSFAYSYRGSALKALGEKQLAMVEEPAPITLKLAIESCKKAIQLNPGQKPVCEWTIHAAEDLLEGRQQTYSGMALRFRPLTDKKAEEMIRRIKMDMDAHPSEKNSSTSKPEENAEPK